MPLFRILYKIISPVILQPEQVLRSSDNQIFFGSITLFGVILHGCYVYSTKNSKVILVREKYTFTEKGFSQFCISAYDEFHPIQRNSQSNSQSNLQSNLQSIPQSIPQQYLIPHSIWYWQFDVNEKYQSTEINKRYKITYYGYRIPFLGIFPNIINMNELETKRK